MGSFEIISDKIVNQGRGQEGMVVSVMGSHKNCFDVE